MAAGATLMEVRVTISTVTPTVACLPLLVTVMVAEPLESATTRPAPFTAATAGALEEKLLCPVRLALLPLS